MKWNILVLLVVINAVKESSCAQNEEYCYSNDPDKKQAKFYSTKTAYEVARGSEKKYFSVPSEFIFYRACLNINFLFIIQDVNLLNFGYSLDMVQDYQVQKE